MTRKMRILITGVHGFVGSNLVKALSKDFEIYGLDIVSPEREGVVKTFSWDDLAHGVLPEVDAIIHLAGKAHDTKNQSQAEVYFQVNTELTKRIYDYFLASSARRFVFFSSVKAAADRVEGPYVDENVEPKPVGPYGESKIEAEHYIMRFLGLAKRQSRALHFGRDDNKGCRDDNKGCRDDKRTYILRPCMIHGPGNKGNLNLLYGVVKRGFPWPLGAFENKRTFTSIDNVCYIVHGLLTKEVESGIYHINDDEAVSTNELIEIICSALGKKAHIWRVPRGLMEGIARIGGILHLPLNPERLRKLTENYVSSNAKIKRALGIEKLPVRAKDGLYKTIKAFENKK
jgi:nucleoside-diphosphate-sugar epimerase